MQKNPVTPLHLAIGRNSLSLVKLLIEAGADTHMTSLGGPISEPSIPLAGINFHHNFAIADYILKVEEKRGITEDDPEWSDVNKNYLAGIRAGVTVFRSTGDIYGGYGPSIDIQESDSDFIIMVEETYKSKTSKKQHSIIYSCSICGEFSGLKLLKCGGCKAVSYCNKECQLSHWKAGHKHECVKKKK